MKNPLSDTPCSQHWTKRQCAYTYNRLIASALGILGLLFCATSTAYADIGMSTTIGLAKKHGAIIKLLLRRPGIQYHPDYLYTFSDFMRGIQTIPWRLNLPPAAYTTDVLGNDGRRVLRTQLNADSILERVWNLRDTISALGETAIKIANGETVIDYLSGGAELYGPFETLYNDLRENFADKVESKKTVFLVSYPNPQYNVVVINFYATSNDAPISGTMGPTAPSIPWVFDYSEGTLTPGHLPISDIPPISGSWKCIDDYLGFEHWCKLTYVIDLEKLYARNLRGNFYTSNPFILGIREGEWLFQRLGITHQVNLDIRRQQQLPIATGIKVLYFNNQEACCAEIHRDVLWETQSIDDPLSNAVDFEELSPIQLTLTRRSDGWHYVDGKRYDTALVVFDVESGRVQTAGRLLQAYVNKGANSAASHSGSESDTYVRIDGPNTWPDGSAIRYSREGKGKAWFRLPTMELPENYRETVVFGASYRYPNGMDRILLQTSVFVRSSRVIVPIGTIEDLGTGGGSD